MRTLKTGKESLMVKMEQITPPQPPSKLEFLESLKQDSELYDYYNGNYDDNYDVIWDVYYHGITEKATLLAEYNFDPTLADLETSSDLLAWFEEFQSEKLQRSIFEEYFNGDWRLGQEVHKVVITQRLYQTSPNSTQA